MIACSSFSNLSVPSRVALVGVNAVAAAGAGDGGVPGSDGDGGAAAERIDAAAGGVAGVFVGALLAGATIGEGALSLAGAFRFGDRRPEVLQKHQINENARHRPHRFCFGEGVSAAVGAGAGGSCSTDGGAGSSPFEPLQG